MMNEEKAKGGDGECERGVAAGRGKGRQKYACVFERFNRNLCARRESGLG